MEPNTTYANYHSTPSVRFNRRYGAGPDPPCCRREKFAEEEYPECWRQSSIEEWSYYTHQNGIYAYPDFKGKLTLDQSNETFVFMALREPWLGEEPTHQRLSDGTVWVERDLRREEKFWWTWTGSGTIPIEGTEAALSTLTVAGEPGCLARHHLDYHPQDDNLPIIIPIEVDLDTLHKRWKTTSLIMPKTWGITRYKAVLQPDDPS